MPTPHRQVPLLVATAGGVGPAQVIESMIETPRLRVPIGLKQAIWGPKMAFQGLEARLQGAG